MVCSIQFETCFAGPLYKSGTQRLKFPNYIVFICKSAHLRVSRQKGGLFYSFSNNNLLNFILNLACFGHIGKNIVFSSMFMHIVIVIHQKF